MAVLKKYCTCEADFNLVTYSNENTSERCLDLELGSDLLCICSTCI